MHGSAQWTMFVGLFGGNTIVLSEPAVRRRRDLGPRRTWGVSVISLVGGTMARPLVGALAHRPPPATLFAVVSGGAISPPP
jgi:hypothetical protein